MGTGSLDTFTADDNTVIAPTDGAGDTVKAAESSPDRLASSKSCHFIISGNKKQLPCAIGATVCKSVLTSLWVAEPRISPMSGDRLSTIEWE